MTNLFSLAPTILVDFFRGIESPLPRLHVSRVQTPVGALVSFTKTACEPSTNPCRSTYLLSKPVKQRTATGGLNRLF